MFRVTPPMSVGATLIRGASPGRLPSGIWPPTDGKEVRKPPIQVGSDADEQGLRDWTLTRGVVRVWSWEHREITRTDRTAANEAWRQLGTEGTDCMRLRAAAPPGAPAGVAARGRVVDLHER